MIVFGRCGLRRTFEDFVELVRRVCTVGPRGGKAKFAVSRGVDFCSVRSLQSWVHEVASFKELNQLI